MDGLCLVSGKDWWTRRNDFDLFISIFVLEEAPAGDPEAAKLRMQALDRIPEIEITEMQKNYIMEEIHRIRQEYAKRFDNNLHAICRDAMHKQGRMNRRVVPANPKPTQSKYPKSDINQSGRLG